MGNFAAPEYRNLFRYIYTPGRFRPVKAKMNYPKHVGDYDG